MYHRELPKKFHTVPGNSDYASIIKNDRKFLVVGDSHIKRIRRNDFNKEFKNGEAIFRSFSGANTKQLDHYILPLLVDDKPDAVIIHVGTNDILTNANHKEIARTIIKIGLNCKIDGLNDVVIFSVLIKKNPNLNTSIRRVNDLLRGLCSTNSFGYICNVLVIIVMMQLQQSTFRKMEFIYKIWAQIF